MYRGKLVFAQLMDQLPLHVFRRCVARYAGRYPPLSFSHLDQFLCMAFAQLTYRESLRDIETCLRAQGSKLYHLGIRGRVARSTLADANERRDFRIYRDFATALIQTARELYAGERFAVELANSAYALDTTTVELSLSLFPWAHYQAAKAALRLHTQLDLRGNIPSFVHISDGKMGDVQLLDLIGFEPGSFYIMDRGFVDFARLHAIDQASAFFVIRARSNFQYQRIQSRPIERATGLRCDQQVWLSGLRAAAGYPQPIRRIKFYDARHDKLLVLLTNHPKLPALTIAQLYRCRWQIELFFKWLKQHLRIKAFFGTSENAVKTQIWIAISVYVLVAIVKKRFACAASLYTTLQILSLTLFEKTPLHELLASIDHKEHTMIPATQLNLFEEISGQ